MIIAELIEILTKIDPKTRVGVYVHDKMIRNPTYDKCENVLWHPYFGYRPITQEELDEEILFRKKQLDKCLARKVRKSSNEYQTCLKFYEGIKDIKLIPYFILN
jgi:hypothetical protein